MNPSLREYEIAAGVLESRPEDAERVLSESCGNDPGLEARVRRLLDLNAQRPGFLRGYVLEPALAEAAALDGTDPHDRPGLPPGTSIGQYTVVRLIGSGATADVYEASLRSESGDGRSPLCAQLRRTAEGSDDGEHHDDSRTIALKVIRPGVLLPGAQRRFAFEVSTLSRLSHPNIARLIDAGSFSTPEGPRPFFAMDLVRGSDLVKYADEHALSSRQRLALMAQVCAAIQHAHFAQVLHRDLKPANILVDESGLVKVLDFGVAKSIDSDRWTTAAFSHQNPAPPGSPASSGRFVGTLPYMSPEQLGLRPEPVDQRSDVYALGIILYELLAGRPPYTLDPPNDRFAEFIDAVRSQAAPRLARIDRGLRGGLAGASDIAAKAMDLDPARRYASPGEMGDDLSRVLRGEPISASDIRLLVLVRLYGRRHPRIRTAALAALGALVLIVGTFTMEFAKTKRAEAAARLSRRDTIQLAEAAFIDLYGQLALMPNSTEVRRDLLARTVEQLERIAATDPDDLEVSKALAHAYWRLAMVIGGPMNPHLGDFGSAVMFYDRAIALQRRAVHENAADAEALVLLANMIEHRSMVTVTDEEQMPMLLEASLIAREAFRLNPDKGRRALFSALQRLAVANAAEGRDAEFEEAVAISEVWCDDQWPARDAIDRPGFLHLTAFRWWAEFTIDRDPEHARRCVERARPFVKLAMDQEIPTENRFRMHAALMGLDAQLLAIRAVDLDDAEEAIRLAAVAVEVDRAHLARDASNNYTQLELAWELARSARIRLVLKSRFPRDDDRCRLWKEEARALSVEARQLYTAQASTMFVPIDISRLLKRLDAIEGEWARLECGEP